MEGSIVDGDIIYDVLDKIAPDALEELLEESEHELDLEEDSDD